MSKDTQRDPIQRRRRRLCERHGFVTYGEDPHGLRVDGFFYDDYLMVPRLDEGGGR